MALNRARTFSTLFCRYRRSAPNQQSPSGTTSVTSTAASLVPGRGANPTREQEGREKVGSRVGEKSQEVSNASSAHSSSPIGTTEESSTTLLSAIIAKFSVNKGQQPSLLKSGEPIAPRLRSLTRSNHYESNLSGRTLGRVPMPELLTPDSFRQLLHHIDTFIFDADGVLWLGDEAITGSSTLVNQLISAGKHVLLLTNNATKSRATYAAKLHRLGYSTKLSAKHVINPAVVVADLLERAGLAEPCAKHVYLIGEQGLRDELDSAGIAHFGSGPEPTGGGVKDDNSPILYHLQADVPAIDVGAVVVGYEKHFNYVKLMRASNYLLHPECLFVATNEDETCPGPDPSVLIPDAGPLVAAVRVASGREPLVVGKPQSPAYEYIRRRWRGEVVPGRTLMVGDRLNTDIAFGKQHGMATLLVLSGCHQLEHIEAMERGEDGAAAANCTPDYCAPSLGALLHQRHRDTNLDAGKGSAEGTLLNEDEIDCSVQVAKRRS